MVVMDFQGGRISDDSGSKSTRGRKRNSLLSMPFRCRQRAFLCDEGFEHRLQWIEDRWQTLAGCFAASVCGFANMDNQLHVLVPLEPDAANGWLAEDVVRRWLVTNEARNQPIAARDWLGSKRSIGPEWRVRFVHSWPIALIPFLFPFRGTRSPAQSTPLAGEMIGLVGYEGTRKSCQEPFSRVCRWLTPKHASWHLFQPLG